MDIFKAIQELQDEKQRLDEVITRLEIIANQTAPAQRRGRKFMTAEERHAVSERMREYWAARKKQARSSASKARASGGGPSA
jgi:hypothetical protein